MAETPRARTPFPHKAGERRKDEPEVSQVGVGRLALSRLKMQSGTPLREKSVAQLTFGGNELSSEGVSHPRTYRGIHQVKGEKRQ